MVFLPNKGGKMLLLRLERCQERLAMIGNFPLHFEDGEFFSESKRYLTLFEHFQHYVPGPELSTL